MTTGGSVSAGVGNPLRPSGAGSSGLRSCSLRLGVRCNAGDGTGVVTLSGSPSASAPSVAPVADLVGGGLGRYDAALPLLAYPLPSFSPPKQILHAQASIFCRRRSSARRRCCLVRWSSRQRPATSSHPWAAGMCQDGKGAGSREAFPRASFLPFAGSSCNGITGA